MIGTPEAALTASETAIVLPLVSGPTIAWTPSISISRRASSTARFASAPVSPVTSSTGRPQTPPAALTCAIASRTASSVTGPNSASEPV